MKLQLSHADVFAVVARFPELRVLEEQLKLGTRAELPFDHFSSEQLGFLEHHYKAQGGGMAGRAAQVGTLRQALAYVGRRYEEGELERLVTEVIDFLVEDAVRGWLFWVDPAGKPTAFLVTRIDFTPAGEEETARLLIELCANAMGKQNVQTITIRERDIPGKTVAELLAAKGYLKETPELIAAYERSAKLFFEWRSQYGSQFSATGVGIFAEDPTASHRHTDWTRKSRVVLTTTGEAARVVNDETVLKERSLVLDAPGNVLAKYLRKAERSAKFSGDVEREVSRRAEQLPVGLFTAIPVHGFVLMYHLELHHHVWVHVDDLQPYTYQPGLKDKLVLPREQTDLIDILTAEMDVLMDDMWPGSPEGRRSSAPDHQGWEKR